MQIRPFQSLINFRGATININALSDTHGHLESVDRGYQTLMKNDAFVKEEDGKANYLIVGGDWFISGGKKGFLTDENKPLMKFQAEMFNKFVGKIKEKFPMTKSLFITGNHELDGGVKVFHDTIRDIDADVVMTNLDFNNTGSLKAAVDEGKIVESSISFVTDDKDEDKLHPVLNLGVSPVNMNYYYKKAEEEGLNLIDNVYAPQKFIKQEQYSKTMAHVREQVDNFRSLYPNGTVILTCHTGVQFADNCAKAGGIDLIFDAHEHKNNVRFVEGTPIVALSQNFDKIVNAKIVLDDDGNKKGIDIENLKPFEETNFQRGELSDFYDELFKEDSKKAYTLKCSDNTLNELSTKNIRSTNNHLANFVTDAILAEIKKKDPSVQIFALNASAIRGGFKLEGEPNISPFEISNCLDGISFDQGDIYTNEVSGRELSLMVLDNFLFNRIDTEKNPIIHYSGLTIDKTNFMKEYSKGKIGAELCKYLTLEETGENIDPNKTYKIANPEKYFIKSSNDKIKGMYNSAHPLNSNIHDLFLGHFNEKECITFTPRVRFY